MSIELFEYQKEAVNKLRSGSILVGGVGSGKSRTGLAYYFIKECGGNILESVPTPMRTPKDLYIITTARKRDQYEWESDLIPFLLSSDSELCSYPVAVKVDSWNNVSKYTEIKDSFVIFDEQRVIGSGTWVRSFLKICKNNNWILLSATPGDTWSDYIPVFVANGYYKNRTEFLRRHAVYNRFTKFPKIDRYVETHILVKIRDSILIDMDFKRATTAHHKTVIVPYNQELFNQVLIKRWNIYDEHPIKDVGELCYIMRKVVNSDCNRLIELKKILCKHQKLIIFYNFNYELDLLIEFGNETQTPTAQWNGHKHELIPKTDTWLYLVQYTAGAEGWNCIETDTIVFYSQNYSYKIMLQAAGRIDRLNTSFTDLYYYHMRSNSSIDISIQRALKNKQNFNERIFIKN